MADDDWQVQIVQEIGIAMIRLIPQEWDTANIVLQVTEKGLGSGLQHSAITRQCTDFSPRDPDFVLPDAALMVATRKLELGWVQRRCAFKRAVIRVARSAEDWNVQSQYE